MTRCEREVGTLYRTACQQVAQTRIQNYKRLDFPLALVLGEAQERYAIDRRTGSATRINNVCELRREQR